MGQWIKNAAIAHYDRYCKEFEKDWPGLSDQVIYVKFHFIIPILVSIPVYLLIRLPFWIFGIDRIAAPFWVTLLTEYVSILMILLVANFLFLLFMWIWRWR